MFCFTDEVNIVGGRDGVHFTFSREGRPSGEAFIELESELDCQSAVAKHNEHMGSRYIEGELGTNKKTYIFLWLLDRVFMPLP